MMELTVLTASATDIPELLPVDWRDAESEDIHAPIERASASQSHKRKRDDHADVARSLDNARMSVAAVESLLESVRREIAEDECTALEEGTPRPSAASIDTALSLAQQIADRFHRQPWIDLAGFVEGDGRVGVLAHSMETGRRTTFYVGGSDIRAIQTSVSGRPVWLELTAPHEAPAVLDWITRTD